jgi:hypothetical protein
VTRENAIKILTDLQRSSLFKYSTAPYYSALYLAIVALREQDNRAESDAVKGCDYCQKFDDPCGAPMIASEDDDSDRGIYLYNGFLCANGGSFCDAKVKFCPMCGRRLEEA